MGWLATMHHIQEVSGSNFRPNILWLSSVRACIFRATNVSFRIPCKFNINNSNNTNIRGHITCVVEHLSKAIQE
jgi:hypothetical protein